MRNEDQYSLGVFVTSITPMLFMTSRKALSATRSLLLSAAAPTLVLALLALFALTSTAV